LAVSKLYQYLGALSKEEYDGLSNFLFSGIMGKNEKAERLLIFLFPFHPEFESTGLNESEIANELFGDSPRDTRQGNLKRLKSQLFRVVKNYLAYEALNKPSGARKVQLLLLESLLKRGLPLEFERELRKARKMGAQVKNRSSDYFFFQYRLEDLWRRYAEQYTPASFSFQPFLESFEKYAVIEYLKYSSFAAHLQNIRQAEQSALLLSVLENALENSDLENENPVIRIYSFVSRIFREKPVEHHFLTLNQILNDSEHLLESRERITLYHLIKEYLIYLTNQGGEALTEQLLIWYELLLEKNYLKTPTIAHNDIKNFVSVSTKTGHTERARFFLEKAIHDVQAEFKEDLYLFCKAAILFYEKNWVDARGLLIRVKPINDFYYYDIHTLQLRIAFELNDERTFEAEYENLRKKIDRDNSTSELHLNAYSNFIKISKQVYLQARGSNKRKEKIMNRILETHPLPHTKWLIEKLEEQYQK
jgi:hypothetical protein